MSTLLHRILDQGKEEGRQEGTKITLRKTAKKMLEQGIAISVIHAVTDLSKEEILSLQNQE